MVMQVLRALAQTANVDCGSATQLCAQQPIAGNNTGVVNSIPNQCQPTEHMLWYSFTTNSVGGSVSVAVSNIDCPQIAGVGDELAAVVLAGDGSCDPTQFTVVDNCGFGADAITINTGALAPATTYWGVIAGVTGPSGSAQCDFQVSVGGPGADVLGVDILVSDDVEIGVGESTQLHVEGGTDPTWSPGSGLSSTTDPEPIASPVSTTTYTVSITDGAGCVHTEQVLVEVIRRIAPPNTFTPNEDGFNDVWSIPGIDDYPGAEVLIFDRWGQRVHSSTGYREPWDGTMNGARLPDATYYYHIQLNQLEGQSPPYTGFISIVR